MYPCESTICNVGVTGWSYASTIVTEVSLPVLAFNAKSPSDGVTGGHG